MIPGSVPFSSTASAVSGSSEYRPPLLLRNGHLLTLYPALCRRISDVGYQRERIATPDDDFLDLDWSRVGAKRAVIVSHGLEGDSRRSYMLGMVRALNRAGWDAVAWNYRGCSGQPNRRLRFYHSGATDDLDVVVRYLIDRCGYERIALVGFSLGGNLTLKYLGERGDGVDGAIEAAVAFSVPCDLKESAAALAAPINRLYMLWFIRSLRKKIRRKMQLFPGALDDAPLQGMRTFAEFDDAYTAPMHGFADAEDYWRQCSSRRYIEGIRVPTLLVNAADDSFLAGGCYPYNEVDRNPYIRLEVPRHGGHVGFTTFGTGGLYWSEQRAVRFLMEQGL